MNIARLLSVPAIAAVIVLGFGHMAVAQDKKGAPAATAPADEFGKWEKEMAAFEAADRAHPPPKNAILFIGSSTIRMWTTLEKDFPDHRVINRGFGGSQIVDATHFAPRIVFPCEPRVIFLRSGGNDIHFGKSPEQVFADYRAFVAAVHAKLPKSEIVYLGLFPTIARITEVEKGEKLNALIKEHAAQDPRLKYIDCSDMTSGSDGKPRADLFIADGLHLNAAGYKLLAERVRPFLPPN
jgi:lysophospholipase L1-like esterase